MRNALMARNADDIKALIKRELPRLMREDPELRTAVIDLARDRFADGAHTESRFDRMLDELARDREAQALKSQAWQARFDRFQEEQASKWQAWQARFDRFQEEQASKWQAWQARFDRFQEEQASKWQAWEARFDEAQEAHRRHFDRVHEEIMGTNRRIEQAFGSLGARWGIQTEEAFRNGLAGILRDSFDVEVVHISECDDAGDVFGRPDQVELDLIVRDGVLILAEIKSSMSKGDVDLFHRKARFYEHRHDRKADRLLVIAPWIDPGARKLARALGVETFSYPDEVSGL
jgi:hypothetical protein